MDSVTSSLSPNRALPLLVLRVPEFEHIAWREGKRAARRAERQAARAFRVAAGRVLRGGDRRIHDRGRDVFAVLVAAPPRGAAQPQAAVCRAMLARIASEMASEMASQTGLMVESGWTLVQPPFELDAEIELALERGARERERYEFFAAIGHELRTPLASIRGYLETLLDGGIDSSTSERFLQTAQREALRMGRMLDGMFEFSLLDLSPEIVGARECDIRTQLALACDAIAPLARARRMILVCDAAESLPAAIDPDACLQLLVNLLENATKYGKEGGRIAVTLRASSGDAHVTVDDDGPGVRWEERSSIFALRARGKETAARQGTGIGLAIVKLIAERCGGSVAVSDSPAGGARFEVVLPLKADLATRAS